MIKALTYIFSSRGLVFAFILGAILFGCQKRSQHEQINRPAPDGIEKFLRHVMITHSGIFTLIGAKPITEFELLTTKPSQERLLNIYNSLSQRARDEASFEEFSFHLNEEYELWDAWTKIKDQYMGENFRFFADPHRKERAVFANLTATALILDEHYEDFKKVYGHDFDPTQIVYSIDSNDSEFWKACFTNHYLAGLLYGFGRSNAKLFDWERQKKKPGKARFFSTLHPPPINNPAITQLPLPSFIIYLPLDDKILFYKEMREKIIEFYEGKDFKELTLKLLSDTNASLCP